jgi:thiaminase
MPSSRNVWDVTNSARDLLARTQQELSPPDGGNRLVPLVAEWRVPIPVLGALAAEEHRIITSDYRSFRALADRADEPNARRFFAGLADGEQIALAKLRPLAEECGFDDAKLREYEPQPGCQTYPAYVCSLALNAEPVDAVLALYANFAAWGGYCAEIAEALRTNYGYDDEVCGFFDFFAGPAPQPEADALAAIQAAVDSGWQPDEGRRHGRLLQSYEMMFWNTLADLALSH